ncbi:DUF481 domain-containing protein [Tenacibaculum sp. IB213877]|uniref:DUF481 domain-containing protein n=1 Tax=Tenacibaculum sp. IB213877 TaxID=3097351 RepID=UPI002A5A21AB|nr:DUF481 domain-containing protein [Tenacibaculum sp. IB213877]MDY0780489.1 DUF481 domain-containing protein [Tenacibaculum sp. IB213877]
MSSFFAQSQIINVENLRRVTDTSGWSGYAKVNFQLIKNTNKIFSFSNRIRVQHKKEKTLWLFINDLDFREANSNTLVSKNAQHLRFNYKLKPQIIIETFAQSQQDKISAINFRGLLGSGLRFKLTKSEKYKLYLGSLLMFEHEKSNRETEPIRNDWRNSSYFSFSLYPKENVTIVSTTYFQPRLDQFSDFRVSSQTYLAVEVIKNLSFTATFSYQYDKFPVIGIPNEQYVLTNGLMYSFN